MFGPRLRQLRQAKIKNLHAAVAGQENVLWFEIPVDDAFRVSRRQTLHDLLSKLDSFAFRDLSSLEPPAQRLPFKQLGDEIWGMVLFPDGIDRQHVWMVQHAGGLRFLRETAQAVWI